jgi:hypothetical protein
MGYKLPWEMKITCVDEYFSLKIYVLSSFPRLSVNTVVVGGGTYLEEKKMVPIS